MPRALLLVAAAALFAYPVGVGALFALDAMGGERLVLYQAVYERRFLFDTLVADFLSALPASVLLTLVLAAATLSVQRVAGVRLALLSALLGGSLAGYVAAVSATGVWLTATHALLVLAGAAYSLPIAFAMRHVAAARIPKASP